MRTYNTAAAFLPSQLKSPAGWGTEVCGLSSQELGGYREMDSNQDRVVGRGDDVRKSVVSLSHEKEFVAQTTVDHISFESWRHLIKIVDSGGV